MPIYWGDLHGQSGLSDGQRSPTEYYTYARDEAKLDFCALTDHLDHVPASRLGLMADETWEEIKAAAKQFHDPGKFITLLGFERSVPSWDGNSPGSVCVYYRRDDGPLARPRHPQRDWLRPRALNPEGEMKEFWDAIGKTDHLVAVVHPTSARQGYTWAAAPPAYTIDLVEIYSKSGSCESSDTTFPVLDGAGKGPRPGGSVRDALRAGFRPGFIAGSGTHLGMPGSNIWENDWANVARYDPSGLTAVIADELSRDAIFDALKNRRCYATMGERIQLSFTINGEPMGSILSATGKLRLHVRAVGTHPVKRAEVFRDGEVIHRKVGGRLELDVVIEEQAPTAPAWYYVRVTQAGEAMAWSSPIWVAPPA